MKITKQSLNRIIKEEIEKMEEQGDVLSGTTRLEPNHDTGDTLSGRTRGFTNAAPGAVQGGGQKGVPVQAVQTIQRQLIALTKQLQTLLSRIK